MNSDVTVLGTQISLLWVVIGAAMVIFNIILPRMEKKHGGVAVTGKMAARKHGLIIKENRQLLTEYALDFFQKEIKILFIVPDQQDNGDAADAETPQSKRQQLAGDPLVIMTAEIFRGQVGDIRVGQQSR